MKGLLKTKFNALNDQVPDGAEGLVTQPKELLEVMAQLRSEKISREERIIIYK